MMVKSMQMGYKSRENTSLYNPLKGFVLQPRPYLFSYILFLFLVLATSFLVANCMFFSSDPYVPFKNNEFFLMASVDVILIVLIFVFAYKQFKITPKWWLLILFLTMLASGGVAVFLPSTIVNPENGISFSISLIDGFRSFVLLFCSLLTIYLLLAYLPRMVRGIEGFRSVFRIIIVLALVACVFSYSTEYESYAQIFQGLGWEADIYIGSFFKNPNPYSFLLLLGILSLIYLEAKRPSFWHWIFIFFFMANQCLINSRTSLLLSAFAFISAFIWHIARSFRSHRVRSSIFLTFGIVIFIFLALTPLYLYLDLMPKFSSYVIHLVEQFFVDSNGNVPSHIFSGRLKISLDVINLLLANPLHFVFGFGIYTSTIVLDASFEKHLPIDVLPIKVLSDGGLIMLILDIVLWAYVFVLIVKRARKRSSYAFPAFLAFFLFAFRALMEADDFIRPNIMGIFMLLLTAIPISAERYGEVTKTDFIYDDRKFLDQQGILEVSSVRKNLPLISLWSFPLIAYLLALWPSLSQMSNCYLFDSPYYWGSLAALLFFLPYQVAVVNEAFLHKKYLIACLEVLLVIFSWLNVLLLAFFIDSNWALLIASLTAVSLLLLWLLSYLSNSGPQPNEIGRYFLRFVIPCFLLFIGGFAGCRFFAPLPISYYVLVLFLVLSVSLLLIFSFNEMALLPRLTFSLERFYFVLQTKMNIRTQKIYKKRLGPKAKNVKYRS